MDNVKKSLLALLLTIGIGLGLSACLSCIPIPEHQPPEQGSGAVQSAALE